MTDTPPRPLDPGELMHLAVFQIGLLHLSHGHVQKAADRWAALDALDAQHPLRLFRAGLLHLARDEFDACELCLKKGIKLNGNNDSLNQDMRDILADIAACRRGGLIAAAAERVF
jgi:hypothetical protein